MENNESIFVYVRKIRQQGSRIVSIVEPDGDLYHCKGQLERGDRGISLPGRGTFWTPTRQQRTVGSDTLTAPIFEFEHVNVDRLR